METQHCDSSNEAQFSRMDEDIDIFLPSPVPSVEAESLPKITEWANKYSEFSRAERMSALEMLVNKEICDVQELRHLLKLVEPQLQRDFISLLPKELSLYVLSFLEPSDLLNAARTCRTWRILCEDNLLWRDKCREEALLDDNETFTDFFRHRLSSSTLVVSDAAQIKAAKAEPIPCSSPYRVYEKSKNRGNKSNIQEEIIYKQAYLQQKSIEYNWRYGELNYTNSENVTIPLNPVLDNNQQPSVSNNNNDANVSQNNEPNNNTTESRPEQVKRKRRTLKSVLVLKGHDDHVITCLQYNPASNIIVSGSDDNTLKVWSSVSGRCLRTLVGHTGGVWSSQLSSSNIIISGSTDRTLRVWNALNGNCIHTLYGHTSTVRCMSLHGIYVVSGSRDASLRLWNIETGTCEHVLIGHMGAVRCVQFNGKLCVSGAYDFLVKVWDVFEETCLYTLEGHSNRVYSLQFDGHYIVSGSLDTSIRVWEAHTGKLRHTLVGHQSLTSGMLIRGHTLISGNADSTVKVWDMVTGQCLLTLAGSNKHHSAVTCLQYTSKFIITSSDDGSVKLWDIKTGDFIRNLVTLSSGGAGAVVWRIRASNTKLVCAVGSRNGTEETKLIVLDFDCDHKFATNPCQVNPTPSREFIPYNEHVDYVLDLSISRSLLSSPSASLQTESNEANLSPPTSQAPVCVTSTQESHATTTTAATTTTPFTVEASCQCSLMPISVIVPELSQYAKGLLDAQLTRTAETVTSFNKRLVWHKDEEKNDERNNEDEEPPRKKRLPLVSSNEAMEKDS